MKKLLGKLFYPEGRMKAMKLQKECMNEPPSPPKPKLTKYLIKKLFRESITAGTKSFIFGFIDQGIMVAAGDEMDDQVKILLGLTGATATMVAAGIGNAISDAFGEGCSFSIEKKLEKMGLSNHMLTPEEEQMKCFKIVRKWSPVVGIFLGCSVGLIVLPIKRLIMG